MSREYTKTAEDIGAKVGDQFITLAGNAGWDAGVTVTLTEDDGSRCPWFVDATGNGHYAYIEAMRPVGKDQDLSYKVEVNEAGTSVTTNKKLSFEQVQQIVRIIGGQ